MVGWVGVSGGVVTSGAYMGDIWVFCGGAGVPCACVCWGVFRVWVWAVL